MAAMLLPCSSRPGSRGEFGTHPVIFCCNLQLAGCQKRAMARGPWLAFAAVLLKRCGSPVAAGQRDAHDPCLIMCPKHIPSLAALREMKTCSLFFLLGASLAAECGLKPPNIALRRVLSSHAARMPPGR